MNLNRRSLIKSGAAGAAFVAFSGCKSFEQQFTHVPLNGTAFSDTGAKSVDPIHRLLSRLSFGVRPGDVENVSRQGASAFIESQLNPHAIAEDNILVWRIRPLNDVLQLDSGTLYDVDDRSIIGALTQAALLRATYSKRQIYERMAAFWSDHFNIYAKKAYGSQLIVADQRDAIRPHALGNFGDLLKSVAHSSAMMGYLDADVNRKGVPNENYARELLELHTLGVNSGYTQKDIQEVSRCLTGWTSEQHWHRGRFAFRSDWHDYGAKTVLGVNIPAGGGLSDGQKVLDIVAQHPATARHIASKLCAHFTGEVPKQLCADVATCFRDTKGDIKSLLRIILNSSHITSGPPVFKTPFEYLVSSFRATVTDTDAGKGVQPWLETMGEPLFGWAMPDGYPEKTSVWSSAILPRWNFVSSLVSQRIANTTVKLDPILDAGKLHGISQNGALILAITGHVPRSPQAERLVSRLNVNGTAEQICGLLLMSPDFQWR